MFYTTVLANKEWKIYYIITRYLSCAPVECYGSLSISAKTMEEAIRIAKIKLGDNVEFTRCEVYK